MHGLLKGILMNSLRWIALSIFTLIQISCGGSSSPAPSVPEENNSSIDSGSDQPDIQTPVANPFEMHSETFSAQAAISSGKTRSTSERFKATHQLSVTRQQ